MEKVVIVSTVLYVGNKAFEQEKWHSIVLLEMISTARVSKSLLGSQMAPVVFLIEKYMALGCLFARQILF